MAVTLTRTLPDHGRCDTHEHYLLSCADYEELLAESSGGCQICGFPAARMPQQKLYIDHDGYLWAVRGLLCISCNSGLGNYHHPTPAGADRYLANAWHLRKAAHLGVSLTRHAEPGPDVVLVDHRDVRWSTSGDGRWWPDRGYRRYRSWDQLYRRCGPLRLRQSVKTEEPPLVAGSLSRTNRDGEFEFYPIRVHDPDDLAQVLRTVMSDDERRRLSELLADEAA
jgi:hypothetical protein